YMHLRRSEFKQALDELERARRIAPRSADVAKLSGWAYYGMNKLNEAVAEWKRALALHPDPEVEAALQKAQRDQQEEEKYRENESSHFTLRFTGAAAPDLTRDVLRTLENEFEAIESALNYSPPEPIGVVLYTQEAFADITRAPGWAGALNDGRIRVPVQGLTSVSPQLARVLKHELTHSFLTQKTGGRCPVWLSEGIAQWMEGRRSSENAAALVQAYEAKQFLPLDTLEGPWMRLSGNAASQAYAWSLANVEYLLHSAGMEDLSRILDLIASGSSTEVALREVLHSDYGELMAGTANYLRKHYLR
ncbi:MAG TPA: peptidase MA family metallohydrolase, partial [Candidatus Acidoferrales bacterium]|nr:peptidase MA family metallohydrolase [Candidatus Acidoferrales bacterium]